MIARIIIGTAATSLLLSCSDKSEFKGGVATQSVQKPASNDAVPTPDPVVKDPISAPVESETISDRCKGSKLEQVEQAIVFPEKKGCEWKSPAERKDRYLTDMQSSEVALKIPSDGILCDIDISSADSINFRYDDMLIFSLEDSVLFSSNEDLKKRFTKTGEVYTWSKDKLVSLTEMFGEFDGAPYCLGDGQCIIPKTDEPGKLSVKMSIGSLAPIVAKFKGKSSLPLVLAASGDNDDSDCSHSELKLTVKMKFAK